MPGDFVRIVRGANADGEKREVLSVDKTRNLVNVKGITVRSPRASPQCSNQYTILISSCIDRGREGREIPSRESLDLSTTPTSSFLLESTNSLLRMERSQKL